MTKPSVLPNIAFFDSGQGGLTIWESVLKRFPKLNTQYLGDNARCPYGNKSEDTITRYASEAVLFLSQRNVQLLVVACGTASSVATKHLQSVFKLPIVGIVEGFCQFVAQMLGQDRHRTVAVLATRFTIKSQAFVTELERLQVKNVWQKACPLFVPFVEEGISQGAMVEDICQMYLEQIPADTKIIMLACTHYPRLAKAIAHHLEKALGRSVVYKTWPQDLLLGSRKTVCADPIYLVDPSIAIIEHVEQFIKHNDPKEQLLFSGQQHILCTDSCAQFEKVAKVFTDTSLQNIQEIELGV